MINEVYKDMLKAKSVIRELSEYATKRAGEIGPENVFDYSLGNPSVPAPDSVKEAIVSIYNELGPMEIHGYSPTLGIPSVKTAISESLNRRFNMNYGPEHIFPTSGAAGAIAHAIRAVTVPGKKVLGFAPFFPEYIHYVGGAGVDFVAVPPDIDTFMPDMEKFRQMLDKDTAAVLINSPNNPSGVVYDEESLKALSNILKEKSKEFGHSIYLISDEPYREISYTPQGVPYPAAFYDNTLTCYSFSKSLSLPGERIGYIAVNPKAEDAEVLVPMFGQISRGTGHNCPTSTMQLAIARLLDETSDISVYRDNKDILYNELTKLGLRMINPGGTFYIFGKAVEESATEFCKKALKYDIVIVPSESFGIPGYFRISYCVPTEKVRRSIEAFKRFIEEEYGNN